MSITITARGNATSDLELRYGPSGTAAGSFTLAVDHNRKRDGEWVKESTSFLRVSVFGRRAEYLADHVRKGTSVVVTGQLKVRQYEGRDGTRGTSVDVKADAVGVVPRMQPQTQSPQTPGLGHSAPSDDPWATDGVRVEASGDQSPPF